MLPQVPDFGSGVIPIEVWPITVPDMSVLTDRAEA